MGESSSGFHTHAHTCTCTHTYSYTHMTTHTINIITGLGLLRTNGSAILPADSPAERACVLSGGSPFLQLLGERR